MNIELQSEQDFVVDPRTDRTLIFVPGGYFRPRQIVIPHDVARHFVLTGLSINGDNQFMGSGSVPALLFSDLAMPEVLDLGDNQFMGSGSVPALLFSDLAMPEVLDLDAVGSDQEIKISFTNVSDEPRLLSLKLLGDDEPAVQQVDYRGLLGLGQVMVGPGIGCRVNLQPFWCFRAERLVVPSTIAPHFVVTDINVGAVSQVVLSASMPAVLFVEHVHGGLDLDECDPSMFLTILVKNTSRESQIFGGAWVGRVRKTTKLQTNSL